MNPYRTADAPASSGVMPVRLERAPFETPVGIAVLITVITIFFTCLLLGSTTGCSAAQLKAAEAIAADTAQCLIAHQDAETEVALLTCGVQAADEIIAKEILGEARKQSARKAAEAYMRAAHEAEEKRAAGCAKDGGK